MRSRQERVLVQQDAELEHVEHKFFGASSEGAGAVQQPLVALDGASPSRAPKTKQRGQVQQEQQSKGEQPAKAQQGAGTQDVPKQDPPKEEQQGASTAQQQTQQQGASQQAQRQASNTTGSSSDSSSGGAAAVAAAAAAAAAAGAAAPGSVEQYHVVMSTNVAIYTQWQSWVMYYWYKKAKAASDASHKAMGGFTRLLSG
jgi:hypothetical protein